MSVCRGLYRVSVLLAWWIAFAVGARAQDTRAVAEPQYPPICKILYADLTPHEGTLPEEPIERHYRDNDRIEKAMENCPAGKAVVLHGSKTGKTIFLISPLRLRAGVTLIVDGSAALWGSRDPRNYDVTAGSCGVVMATGAERGAGCLPLLLAEDAPHSGVMGEGVVDGRGGAKLLGAGGGSETWWELAHRAKIEDGQQMVPRLVVVRRSNDFRMYHVTLRNSPNCHVAVEATNGFTAWGVRIDAPKWARNTDGIDPQAGSTNLSIVDTFIRAGDDNISPKANGAAVSHMTVRDTHFYNGHGFGIGSQTMGGVSAIRVNGLTIDGSDDGLRITSDRSRGGMVEDVHFENVCMRNVSNPIVLNPFYTTFEGTKIPWFRDIELRNVHAAGGGVGVTMAGLDAAHRLEATLENVVVDGLKSGDIVARHAVFTLKHGDVEPGGEDVKVIGAAGGGAAYGCEGKFVPFRENTISPVSAEIVPAQDNTFYVAADGTGDYSSVQAALNKVPKTGGLVLVAPGTYRERLLVRQSHVTLKSANGDARRTVIVFDLSRGTQGGQDGVATVRVRGDDFMAENMTFENDYNSTHKQENQGSQAPAPALNLQGDRMVLRNVRVLGNQGTFYLGAKDCGQATGSACEAGRSYIVRSYIAGNVDFILGDGEAYFDDCELHSTEHAPAGVVTAQGKHYAAQESLFVFRNARLTADAGAGKVFLGRPWRDFATVVFLNPQLGPQIAAAGWREPGAATHRGEMAYFRIANPSGPGAPTASKQLTAAEAARYTPREVLGGRDGWDPTGVR